MNVLELGMGWFPEQAGGLNRVYYDLVRSLPAVGVNCVGVIAGSASLAAPHPLRPPLRIASPLEAGTRQRLAGMRRTVGRSMADDGIDVVAAHFAYYAWPALRAIKRTPLVVHFHGPWSAESRAEGAGTLSVAFKHWIERRVYRRAKRLIVLSQAFASVLSTQYGIDRSIIRLVPGQVDTERFNVNQTRQDARRQLNWPTDRPIVVAVRRLVKRMGLEELITAAATVRQQIPDALVLIAGKGPLATELQQRIDSAGLQETVRLLGYVPDADLPCLYRAADLSVVPTVSLEGFGLIAAESLAAGTPVLVTPVGGLPEVVRDLSPALVLSGTDAGTISAGIVAALRGEIALPSEADCRAYAVERFDRIGVAEQTKRVYEEAIQA